MAIELEGKRKADGAWYQCHVSICWEGQESVLKVRFKGGDEDYLFTPDEAKLNLRPQSKKLENGECRRLLIGEIVLAPLRRTDGEASPRFEAQIKKIHRQKHNFGDCSCYVELSWVEKSNGELSSIPAREIYRINLCNSIQDHPIVRDWMESRDKDDGENRDVESDVDAELDLQIDKIAMMADKLDNGYPAPETPSAKSKLRQTRSSERTTRSSSKANLPLSVDKRPRLSPLAARAALAAAVEIEDVKDVPRQSAQQAASKSPSRQAKVSAKKKLCAQQTSVSVRTTRSRLAAARNAGDLSIDLQMHGNLLTGQAAGLVIEIPIYKS